MADHNQGPHYIPELDPENPQHKPGKTGRFVMRTIWILVAAGVASWLGAGVAWYFGLKWLMLALIIAGAVCLALVFPIVGLGG